MELDSAVQRRTFDFLSAMTAVIVLTYLGVAIYAFVTGKITWEVVSGIVGSPATMLLGYWVRGKQA